MTNHFVLLAVPNRADRMVDGGPYQTKKGQFFAKNN
jgi:hypothetical protein